MPFDSPDLTCDSNQSRSGDFSATGSMINLANLAGNSVATSWRRVHAWSLRSPKLWHIQFGAIWATGWCGLRTLGLELPGELDVENRW